MTGYLKLDSTRVSFWEYWRWKPNPAFLILAVLKLLKVRLPATLLLPAVARVDEVTPGAQPPDLVAAYRTPIEACLKKGYEISLWYSVPTMGMIQGLAVALLGNDGLSLAIVTGGQSMDGAQREVHLGLVSRLFGGKILGTSDGGSLFNPAPEIEPLILMSYPHAQMIEAHERRVKEHRQDVTPVGDVRQLLQEMEQLQIDANVTRGIYVPATPEDMAMVARRQNQTMAQAMHLPADRSGGEQRSLPKNWR